jgi:transposase InsO family protein
MDNVGPSRVRSMGGKWYVLVIIDNYSRYSWVFFLESKDKVFEHFQRLAMRLNNEHSNCLRVIHSDNETEFRNASFDEFCLEHGIDQQFSADVFLNIMESWNERTMSIPILNLMHSISFFSRFVFDEFIIKGGVYEHKVG